jgi:hypothetical protein
MAWLSPNRHGYLRICFRWKMIECKEGTKLKDTLANARYYSRNWTRSSTRSIAVYSSTGATSPTVPKRTSSILEWKGGHNRR